MPKSFLTWVIPIAVGIGLVGCKGTPTEAERQSRRAVAVVEEKFQTYPPTAETLNPTAGLEGCLQFAMRHHPQIQAAYDDWRASVEAITLERSRPDPKLTFQTDLVSSLLSWMPGLMLDLPGPTKLGAKARAAAAESQVKYFQFASTVLQTAFEVKKAYFPLHFLDEKVSVNRRTLGLLADLEQLARAQNEVGKATLQDVLRAQIEKEKLRTETVTLEDSRRWLLAQFKAALGLPFAAPDPPVPAHFEPTPFTVGDEELFAAAVKRNPRLKEMEAEIHAAQAGMAVARKENIPDFSAGFTVETGGSPTLWSPQATMTLPVWRDKIAAGIAGAQFRKQAAQARWSAEEISLGVEFAEATFMIREADRQLQLIRERLLPPARQMLDIARAAYRSGQADFLNVIEAQRTLLGLELEQIARQTQREVSLAQLALTVAGRPPAEAPLLKDAVLDPQSTH